jgi:uncharacterized membrane protein
MTSPSEITKRNILNRLWNPKQEDVIAFRVFQMVSIPIIMVLSIVAGIFSGSAIWFFIAMGWLVMAIILYLVSSIRFKINNSISDDLP